MLPALATRILRTTDKRCLWKFAWNFGVRGIRSTLTLLDKHGFPHTGLGLNLDAALAP